MKVGFVTENTVRAFRKKYDGEAADLLVFGFSGLGEVSYEKELKGETDFFKDVALLSKSAKSVVVCGCVTDTRGHKRKSALVAENGRILGVSDMLNVVDGAVSSGAALRVYETGLGRMGVVVAEDIHFPEVVKSLAVCGSDFIVCPFGSVFNSLQTVLLRAHAYCYGVPVLLGGKGYAMIADVSGNIAFASPQSPVYTDFENVKQYHLVETRRRGFFRPEL
ncbi:MAG: hypothetical protein IJX87_03285 [Clostridia bacterium]|nr:hypothetical protein [Clostridia bacterium]